MLHEARQTTTELRRAMAGHNVDTALLSDESCALLQHPARRRR